MKQQHTITPTFSRTLTRLVTLLVATVFLFSSCIKDILPGHGGDSPSSLAYREILDTAYGEDAKQTMDIYLPAGRTKNTRLIVMIHGGGWQAGDKNEFNYYKNLIRQKWPEAAIANVNYRLASNVNNIHHNQIMSDISAAVQFLISNKISFAVSDTLAMVGESAGAHLSMLYTYAYNTNNYVKCVGSLYGPTQIADWDWYNSFNLFFGRPVSEILSTYVGSTWNADLYKSISPYERVNASNAKPTIIFHGTVDVVVPIYQSQWLNGKLGNLGAVHQYHEYFLDGHGFNSTNAADCATKLVAFFKQNAK